MSRRRPKYPLSLSVQFLHIFVPDAIKFWNLQIVLIRWRWFSWYFQIFFIVINSRDNGQNENGLFLTLSLFQNWKPERSSTKPILILTKISLHDFLTNRAFSCWVFLLSCAMKCSKKSIFPVEYFVNIKNRYSKNLELRSEIIKNEWFWEWWWVWSCRVHVSTWDQRFSWRSRRRKRIAFPILLSIMKSPFSPCKCTFCALEI